jgi:hypothetical protein
VKPVQLKAVLNQQLVIIDFKRVAPGFNVYPCYRAGRGSKNNFYDFTPRRGHSGIIDV